MISYPFVQATDAEERKRERKERYQREKLELQKKDEAFIRNFKFPYDHPIPDSARIRLAKIELIRSKRNYHNETTPQWNLWIPSKNDRELLNGSLPPEHTQSVYIIDKELNIVDWVKSKNEVGTWIYQNKHRNKALGRTTVYEYIKNKWLYKDKFYFVPVKEYEEFMESKKN